MDSPRQAMAPDFYTGNDAPLTTALLLAAASHDMQAPQQVKVDRPDQAARGVPALGHHGGEQPGDRIDVPIGKGGRVRPQLLHQQRLAIPRRPSGPPWPSRT